MLHHTHQHHSSPLARTHIINDSPRSTYTDGLVSSRLTAASCIRNSTRTNSQAASLRSHLLRRKMVDLSTEEELEKGFNTLDGQPVAALADVPAATSQWRSPINSFCLTWPFRSLGSPGVGILLMIAGTILDNWVQLNLSDQLYDPAQVAYKEATTLANGASIVSIVGFWHTTLAAVYAGLHLLIILVCLLFGWFVPTSFCGVYAVKF